MSVAAFYPPLYICERRTYFSIDTTHSSETAASRSSQWEVATIFVRLDWQLCFLPRSSAVNPAPPTQPRSSSQSGLLPHSLDTHRQSEMVRRGVHLPFFSSETELVKLILKMCCLYRNLIIITSVRVITVSTNSQTVYFTTKHICIRFLIYIVPCNAAKFIIVNVLII